MIDGDRLPTIETPRLRLRWLTGDDVPILYEIFSDPEAMKYWSSPPLPDLASAAALLADIRQHFAAGDLPSRATTGGRATRPRRPPP